VTVVVAAAAVWIVAASPARATALAVPVLRQAPERCGPAALEMVMRFYGADSAGPWARRAYDPVLRGALITDLEAAARRGGLRAAVERPGEDSLRALLGAGVPPVLLYDRGMGPLVRRHYAVLVGWDPARGEYLLLDGGARPRRIGRGELMRRWRAAGGEALVVRRPG
jgi:hypothetical protein